MKQIKYFCYKDDWGEMLKANVKASFYYECFIQIWGKYAAPTRISDLQLTMPVLYHLSY